MCMAARPYHINGTLGALKIVTSHFGKMCMKKLTYVDAEERHRDLCTCDLGCFVLSKSLFSTKKKRGFEHQALLHKVSFTGPYYFTFWGNANLHDCRSLFPKVMKESNDYLYKSEEQ